MPRMPHSATIPVAANLKESDWVAMTLWECDVTGVDGIADRIREFPK